jgi:hypothetical protein
VTAVRPVRAVTVLSRATGPLVALVGVLVGTPVGLARAVGWPLPRAVPSWSEVGHALGGSLSDDVVMRGMSCAAWVLWALVLASFLAEVVGWVRGREAGRLPLAGLVQPTVRELVVSVALLAGALRPSAPAVAVGESAPVLASSVLTSAPVVATSAGGAGATAATGVGSVGPAMPAPQGAPADAVAAGLVPAAGPVAINPTARPVCVVAPRDSLWKLAGRHLGDPRRWREIWDLNRGTVFPDGRRFTNSNLIHPGWVLVMPADAVGLEATGAEPPPPSPSPVPAPVPSSPLPTTSPPARAPVPARDTPAQAVPSRSEPSSPPTALSADSSQNRRNSSDEHVAPLLAASALVAAGVIAKVTSLRRRQQGHRSTGRMIRLPAARAARSEVHLRRAATGTPFDRLDLVLRTLAYSLGRRRPGSCPAISVLSVGPEAIEILLAEPVDAPSGPFDVTAGGRAWTLPATVPDDELRPLADQQSGPAPALVTVGTVDERTVLIDLEAGARTIVGGDPDDAQALLWTMAVELATSNRADDLSLVLVGKAPSGLDVLDRVQVVDSVEQVLSAIEDEASAITATLAEVRRSSTFDARAADPTLLLTPTVVLVADPTSGPGLDRLMAAAGESHGLAILVAGDADEAFDRELCVEEDTLLVKPLGLRLRPAALPAGVIEDVGEILSTAIDLQPGPALDLDLAPACRPPHEGITIGPDRLRLTFDTDGRPVVPDGHVLVRVLGSVDVLGGEERIDRRRCIELVAYLALHPEGVEDGRIKAALWPESTPTRGAFNETVSRARRLLGHDPTGIHHVLKVDNRRYRLGPYVVTDASLFEAYQGTGEVARLVRGIPFEGTDRGYEWAYEEGIAYRLSAIIEECGER